MSWMCFCGLSPGSTVQDDDSWLGRRRKDASDDSSVAAACIDCSQPSRPPEAQQQRHCFRGRKPFNVVQQTRFVSARIQNSHLKSLHLEDVGQHWNNRSHNISRPTREAGTELLPRTPGQVTEPMGHNNTRTWEHQHAKSTGHRDGDLACEKRETRRSTGTSRLYMS